MILNETQLAIQDAVRSFAQERIRPHSAAYEAAGGYPEGLFEEVASLGLLGMVAPEQFGGADADYVSYALSLIELAAADGALSTVVSIQNSLLVGGLRHFAQSYNMKGAASYLAVIIPLTVIPLVLPNFTTSTGEGWSSRTTFLLAAIGAADGLGNI